MEIIFSILILVPIFFMLLCAMIIAGIFTIQQVKDFIEDIKLEKEMKGKDI